MALQFDNAQSGLSTIGTPVASNPSSNPSQVAQIAQAVAANQGVVNLSNGVAYNIYPIPTSLTYTVTSNTATGGIATTIYAFNNSDLNALVTTNGSGGASIVNTFGDGFSGRNYAQYFRSANNGTGMNIVAFTIQSATFGGTAAPQYFSGLNLTFITYNGYGQSIPVTVDLNQALRNTQYNSGMLTLGFKVTLNALTQMTMLCPANSSFTFTFFTDASGFTS